VHRVFLDANVLFSAAYQRDSGLRALWRPRETLLTSGYCLAEARLNLSEPDAQTRLTRLVQRVSIVPEPAATSPPDHRRRICTTSIGQAPVKPSTS